MDCTQYIVNNLQDFIYQPLKVYIQGQQKWDEKERRKRHKAKKLEEEFDLDDYHDLAAQQNYFKHKPIRHKMSKVEKP